MADQKNRGGQKRGNQQPRQPEQKQGVTETSAGKRSATDKRNDQTQNPDDEKRRDTNRQR